MALYNRESLIARISQFLEIEPALISNGGSVEAGFLDRIAAAKGIPLQSGNAYRKLEQILKFLGANYDPELDSSESHGISGGGTITNHGWRKLFSELTGEKFTFLISGTSVEPGAKQVIIPSSATGLQALMDADDHSYLIIESKQGGELIGFEVTKISKSSYETFIGLNNALFLDSILAAPLMNVIGQSTNSIQEIPSLLPPTENPLDRSKVEMPNEIPEDSFEVDIRPDANSLKNYKALDYTAHYALGEFIDNSITSAMRDAGLIRSVEPLFKLEIHISFDSSKNILTVKDNAAGIPKARIPDALATGRTANASAIGLGRYGVGMKAAAFWWGSKLEVETYPIGEEHGWSVVIDVSGDDDVPAKVTVVPIPQNGTHGTTIRVHDLWKKVPATKTVTKIKAYLPSIYREYLGKHTHEEIQLDCSIFYEGQELRYEEPKILFAPYWSDRNVQPPQNAPKKLWKTDEFTIQLPSGAEAKGWIGILEKMSRDVSGLVLKYKGKIVVGAAAIGDESGSDDSTAGMFKPKEIFGQAGSAVNQTIIGEFEINGVPKTLTTNGFQWTDADRDAFIEFLHKSLSTGDQPYLTMARNYRRRLAAEPKVVNVKEQDEKELQDEKEAWDSRINHDKVGDSDNGPFSPDSEAVEGVLTLPLTDNEGHKHTFTLTLLGDPSYDLFKLSHSGTDHNVYVNLNHPLFDDLEDVAQKRLTLQKIFMTMALAVVLDGNSEIDSFLRKFNNEAKKRNSKSDE